MFRVAMAIVTVFLMTATAFGASAGLQSGNKKDGSGPGGNKAVVVKPGESATVRGCTVTNTGTSKDVSVQPVGTNAVDVNPSAGAEFSVSNLQAGDNVNVTNGSNLTSCTGTGGNINVASNTTGSVSCNAPSTNVMTINTPGGMAFSLTGGNATSWVP